jgi:hypothetical protein
MVFHGFYYFLRFKKVKAKSSRRIDLAIFIASSTRKGKRFLPTRRLNLDVQFAEEMDFKA